MMVFAKSLNKAQLEALVADGGTLDGAKMMLFSNNIVPDEDTVYADLTPASFSGYAASAVLTWGTPYLDGDSGEWALSCAPVEFRSTTATPFVSGTVYGAAIYIPGTPNILRLSGKFDEGALNFNTPDQVLVIRPEIIGNSATMTVMN